MKKFNISLVTLFFTLFVCEVQAQDIKNYASNMGKKEKRLEIRTVHKEIRKLAENNVSDFSLKSFDANFGNKSSNVSWTRTKMFDEATFMKDGHEITAYFDENGRLVGTTSRVSFRDIPALAQKKINKTYKNARIGKVIFFDDNELNDTNMIMFGIQFDDADNYLVEMTQRIKRFILDCNTKGNVAFFKQLSQ